METKDTCLYIHTRKSDGGIFYVGIGDSKRPYSKHNRNRFWKYIVKKHDYEITILKTDMSWKEACELEIKMIAFYGRKDLGLGCLVNMTDGGEGGKGVIQSEGSKQKRRDKMTGEKNPCFGRTGEKNPLFGRTGEKHPTFGIIWSEESNQKRKEKSIGEKNPRAKKVICELTNKIYGCAKDAAKDKEINYQTLMNYLNGNRKNKSSLRFL